MMSRCAAAGGGGVAGGKLKKFCNRRRLVRFRKMRRHRLSPQLVFVVLVSFFAHPSQATWNKIAQFNGMLYGSAIFFLDDKVGVIAGNDGLSNPGILRTTDGGLTWKAATIPVISGAQGFDFGDIWFRNQSEGWATVFINGTGYGHLWHTTDAGLNWGTTILSGSCAGVRQTTHALVVAQYGGMTGISISTDDGQTFSNSSWQTFVGIDFVDDLHGVVSPLWGQEFLCTSDGGLTWNKPTSNVACEAWSVHGVEGTATFLAAPELSSSQGEYYVFRSLD